MGRWERIKPNRERELAELRASQSPESRRRLEEAGERRRAWLAQIAGVLREAGWAPLAAADQWERERYAGEVGGVLALGTDADVADYLRVTEADPPERPARPPENYLPLVARLRALDAPRGTE